MVERILDIVDQQDRSVFRAKVERLKLGASPRTLDLFAGCGGLSLGFYSAGYSIVGAVEIDSFAAQSHARNFHQGNAKHARPRDVTV